jgi:serine/threonine protein kinase
MANPTATVTEFCTLLARSQLLPADEVSDLHQKWKTDPAAADADVDGFRKYLVTRRRLTEYQAALVQRGRAEGFHVGGYVILDRIGKGGRSAGVYLATHSSGQRVALKVLPASKARNPQVLARFQREGRLLTQLNHPNIVRAFQLGSTNSIHYIVMEHLEGETFDEVLVRRKQLPPAEAARLVVQALEGLQHLHQQRMVHRDLKPANLMVIPGPASGQPDTTLAATVKILDIGLGREMFDEEAAGGFDAQLTAEGAVLGTPDYLAPEQARDARSADIRSDIYSLGCVLYHLLAGRPPFTERNVMASMVKHATEPVPPVQQFAPAVPPGLAAALDRMLAKGPGGRFATPGEAAEALRAFVPSDSVAAAESKMLPAYEKWLETESVAEPPPDAIGATRPPPRAGFTGLPSPKPDAAAPTPAPPLPPVKPGTGPAPALKKAAGVQAAVAKPPAAAPRPAQPPTVAARDSAPEFDVDLVTLPGHGTTIGGETRPAAPPRPLYDLDRRDFVMLALGAGGVVAAIFGGFLAARAFRPRAQGDDEERKDGQP